WSHHMRPGTTIAIYMGVQSAGAIASDFQSRGADPSTPVDLAVEVSTRHQRMIRTDLRGLASAIRAESVSGTALILIRFRKQAAARSAA
ncbi:MAG: hypothetical protein AAGI50_14305, partial [Pseudomonadota bacterium]